MRNFPFPDFLLGETDISLYNDPQNLKVLILFRYPLHSFEANWSILKFANDSRRLMTLAFSVAVFKQERSNLSFLSVHVKDLFDAHVKDKSEMARVKGFEI